MIPHLSNSISRRSYGTPISTVKSTDESISASLPTNQSQLLCRRINLSFSPSPPPKNLSAASHNSLMLQADHVLEATSDDILDYN
ncbi:hypothetical protein P8452_38253 [Trifolium repens]|nr:hypothetical protein P8452_38253 [Trifolium repens]